MKRRMSKTKDARENGIPELPHRFIMADLIRPLYERILADAEFIAATPKEPLMDIKRSAHNAKQPTDVPSVPGTSQVGNMACIRSSSRPADGSTGPNLLHERHHHSAMNRPKQDVGIQTQPDFRQWRDFHSPQAQARHQLSCDGVGELRHHRLQLRWR